MFEQIYAAVEENDLKGRVHVPGYLALEELPTWYGAATVFVYPSLYEGFGLPPLEAMACGTPVVVANTSSLPEVVGDAGVRVDPHDAEQLAVVLEELLQSNQRREQMSAAGLSQAASFTWERTADQMSQLYRVTSGKAA
jgi:glycosyltransferase involved in cell wall biosynthesis